MKEELEIKHNLLIERVKNYFKFRLLNMNLKSIF